MKSPDKNITTSPGESTRETLAQTSTRSDVEVRDSEVRDQTLRRTSYVPSADARDAMQTGRRWRRASRWIGLLVFALGAVLMCWVLLQAIDHFRKLNDNGYLQFQVNRIAGDGYQQQILAYVSVFGGELMRFLYLLLMGVLGSFIASRGIQFFAASESVIDEAVVPYEE